MAVGGGEEHAAGFLEFAGFVGVEPVACAGEFGEAGFGKEASDRLAVFGFDVMAFRAGEEQGRMVEAALGFGPADDVWHLARQSVEVEPPAGAVFGLEVERLEEEGAEACVLDMRGQAADVLPLQTDLEMADRRRSASPRVDRSVRSSFRIASMWRVWSWA